MRRRLRRRAVEDILGRLDLVPAGAQVEVVDNEYASTCAVAHARIADAAGTAREFFVKSGFNYVDRATGHRRGPSYEASVYRTLEAAQSSEWRPTFFGGLHAGRRGSLVVGYLSGFSRLDESEREDAVCAAAEVLGGAHRDLSAAAISDEACLNRIDQSYLAGWGRRFETLSQRSSSEAGQLSMLVSAFRDLSPVLVEPPVTVIHGELFPNNVMVGTESVRIIDWDAAAVGPGEVDLAALTEGWPRGLAQAAVERYRIATQTWSAGNTLSRLQAARLLVGLQTLWHVGRVRSRRAGFIARVAELAQRMEETGR